MKLSELRVAHAETNGCCVTVLAGRGRTHSHAHTQQSNIYNIIKKTLNSGSDGWVALCDLGGAASKRFNRNRNKKLARNDINDDQ